MILLPKFDWAQINTNHVYFEESILANPKNLMTGETSNSLSFHHLHIDVIAQDGGNSSAYADTSASMVLAMQ